MHWRPVTDVLTTYVIYLSIVGFVLVLRPSFPIVCVAAVALSLTLHRLALFIHAAIHWEFHENRLSSDWIFARLLGWFFGGDIRAHRPIHFAHHRNHGRASDPEDGYSAGLNIASLACFIAGRDTASRSVSARGGDQSSRSLTLIAYALHAAVLTASIYQLGFIAGVVFYALPLVVGLRALVCLRNCLEHTPIGGEPAARNFDRGFMSYFIGAGGFRLHGEHHKNPAKHYWELPTDTQTTSYFRALSSVVRQSAKPQTPNRYPARAGHD